MYIRIYGVVDARGPYSHGYQHTKTHLNIINIIYFNFFLYREIIIFKFSVYLKFRWMLAIIIRYYFICFQRGQNPCQQMPPLGPDAASMLP